MTSEEREEMRQLIDTIQTEKNHAEFMKAVQRMNELIGAKERRIRPTAEQDENKK